MNANAIITLLDQTELFGGLSEKSKKMLAEIALPKKFANGQTVFLDGDKAFSVYLLGSGSVELSKTADSDRKVVLRVVKPGEMFGEVVLFQQDRYPATATALRNSTLFSLPKTQVHRLLANETFRNDFIVLLMEKQRYLTKRLFFFQAHDLDERFRLFLREQFGEKRSIQPKMSKKDFASAIGATPESLSRLLFRLKQENMLSWEGKEITVSDRYWQAHGS